MRLIVEDLLAPLGPDRPCGENIRTDARLQERYYRLKDARNAARAAERAIPLGESMRLSPFWQEVNDLCLEILTAASKDLEVLTWLAEAQLRVEGFGGLGDVFATIASLLETYWTDIHSIGDEDLEDKVAPLAGLNGVSSEGSMIQAIRLTPLVPGAAFAQHCLWDYQLAQRPNESERRAALYEATSAAGRAAMASQLACIEQCRAAFANLTAFLARSCGEQAPASSNTRNVLQEVASAIRDISGIGEDEAIDAAVAPDANETSARASPAPPAPRPALPAAIGSRDDAFDLLLAVAHYFRRAEPHSPISLAIETLVRRGRMDFSELLAELLPDANSRNAVLTAAGIRTPTNP